MVIAKAKKSLRLYRLVLLQSSIPRSEVSRNKDFLTVVLCSLIYCWEPIWKGWIGNWMWAIIRMFPWTERVSSHVLFSCHNAVHFKSHFRVLRGYIKREWRKKDTKVTVQTQETQKGRFKHINAGHVVKREQHKQYHQFTGLSTVQLVLSLLCKNKTESFKKYGDRKAEM